MMHHYPCELLARIGFDFLRGDYRAWPGDYRAWPTDEDDPESMAEARAKEHRHVSRKLLDTSPHQFPHGAGCTWHLQITWPDRVPGLVTWSGQQTLTKLIADRQALLGEPRDDLYEFSVGSKTASGIDATSCLDSIDVGFNPRAHDMLIASRPGIELLAIVGLERVPLISYANRECGFAHEGKLYRFTVEPREGNYYHRWGEISTV